MSEQSITRQTIADQDQNLVPLTPELAREIEKMLDKNAKEIEKLEMIYKTGKKVRPSRTRPVAAQV